MGIPFWSSVAAALSGRSMVFIFLGMTLLTDKTNGAVTDSSFYSTSSLDPGSSSCNFETMSALRSTWRSNGELCGQKLPFEFWIYMKAQGTAEDTDANHVRTECLKSRAIGLVELHTPEEWDTTIMDEAPGQLLRETKRSASYLVESPIDFEAMCADDQVTKVSRVDPEAVGRYSLSGRKSKRRLQSTVSAAGNAHGVDLLIAGLEELGCERTTGEDQTLCILSDSFNLLGGQFALQESGDLPPEEFLTVVEELPLAILQQDIVPLDEGSAMTELAYDIAKGASFKFNTMFLGSMAAADDVIKLGTGAAEGGEACDVLVDDISIGSEPGFRDGIVSQAVDEVVANDVLYFSAAANYRTGYKFTANWECTTDVFGEVATDEPCDGNGVASHVFNPDATGLERYMLGGFTRARFRGDDSFFLHWDDDEGTLRNVQLEVWIAAVDDEENVTLLDSVEATSDPGQAITFLSLQGAMAGDLYFFSVSQAFSDLEDVEMRLLSRTPEVFDDFSDGTIFGQQCAASTISVAAYQSTDASGATGRFTDPEEGSVAFYSSRGPCYVNSGSGIENRLKPETTAATALQTSTVGFSRFDGTSASAPVAAAIATIVRAACSPKVVTYSDMMEILTNYDYTIDVTSDAGGEAETWGTEAGYGIISAEQILGWIALNCRESCPGNVTSPTPVPSPVQSTSPPVAPPTPPTILPPTASPVQPTNYTTGRTTYFAASSSADYASDHDIDYTAGRTNVFALDIGTHCAANITVHCSARSPTLRTADSTTHCTAGWSTNYTSININCCAYSATNYCTPDISTTLVAIFTTIVYYTQNGVTLCILDLATYCITNVTAD
ncbi:unnamed protein product [Ascophyllum nodosum]